MVTPLGFFGLMETECRLGSRIPMSMSHGCCPNGCDAKVVSSRTSRSQPYVSVAQQTLPKVSSVASVRSGRAWSARWRSRRAEVSDSHRYEFGPGRTSHGLWLFGKDLGTKDSPSLPDRNLRWSTRGTGTVLKALQQCGSSTASNPATAG